VLGAGLNAPICFCPTWNLGEFLGIVNLGLNVNRKDLDCEVGDLETKSVLVTCAIFCELRNVYQSQRVYSSGGGNLSQTIFLCMLPQWIKSCSMRLSKTPLPSSFR